MPTEVTLKSSLSLSLSLTHTHTQPQVSTILHVRGLPRLDREKLAKRLGQLADNCGGRVVWVDRASGTARILFRSQEWAVK